MPSVVLFYEWIVWFKDGSHIAQHTIDGDEVMWSEVKLYHANVSPARRAGWLPFDRNRADSANAKYGGAQCIPRPNNKAHFVEVVNGELPFMRRRLEFGWYGKNQGSKLYYYIMGSGGEMVEDDNGGHHYEQGCYMAIDMNGHTRMSHSSNVVVPVIPPEKGDTIEDAQIKAIRS